jgi:hypothetical protein
VGAIELVRREILLWRRTGERWWRIDAGMFAALYAAVSAVVLWALVVLDEPPLGGLAGLVAWLGLLMVLLVVDDRVN